MPLVRVSLLRGKPRAYRAAILENIYQAMIESFNVPRDDQFMVLTEHDPEELVFNRSYMNIERSDGFVLIQLTVSNTRDQAQKNALFKRIVERLGDDPGVRPEDVMISLVEGDKGNWSFGHGIAQYVA
ncbi:tautomerase family protein [Herbaspirillum sp. WKF16]|jgi:phenylpyruvate tautomerase PptA (4-oxalocrotonate tautomerase family)|uniref:tautomerase family protein n=1 Tax=Herbaspirillum sp. WKF16 TaxID=3028312 RepID=UPI0023A98B06|nr:tautomerase family protein [Herbaspirillum sp. WKF16]WDZ97742.1 tautomerase family protein [Herbaspirillum sp. WKF16]